MVSQKYRWDFIGLSTDEKPTSETSDKVVNGSTYYCSDTSKLYVYCDGTWYERKPLGGGGTPDFNDLPNRPKYNGSDMTGSTNIPEVKTYTAGSNVAISDQNVISATDTTYTAGTNVSISDQNVISATDTTYSAFTGTDGTAAGTSGLVPAPSTTDAGKFLKADGTWDTAGGGGSGGGFVELSSTDYNYPVANPNGVHSMYLADGIYKIPKGLKFWGISSVSTTPAAATLETDMYLFVNQVSANDKRAYYIYPGGTGAGNLRGAQLAVCLTGRPNQENYTNSYNTVFSQDVVDGLTSTSTTYPLAAKQGKILNDKIEGRIITNATAPTTATVGTVGQLLEDTTNGKLYICTDTTGGTYTWEEVGAGGGSGPTVVQTTGTSTSDVMSQNAVTSMVYANPSTANSIRIGNTNASANNAVTIGTGTNGVSSGICENAVAIGWGAVCAAGTTVAIGSQSKANFVNGTAIGRKSQCNSESSVALGAFSSTSEAGEVNIGSTVANWGYRQNSNYRLLTGLYDPQNAHDAATKGYVDPTTDSSAPTTATVGRLGQIQIDTTNNDAYMCVAVDDVTPAYTWKKITV